MSGLPPELHRLVDELAQQQDLPPAAASEIQQAILSSPQLAEQMAEAARDGTLQNLRLSPSDANEGGHYSASEKALYINVDVFRDFPSKDKNDTRLDILTATMGHEVEHALQARESRETTAMLVYGVAETIRNAGPGGQADLTAVFDTYLKTMRKLEADAEIAGWNALASRVDKQTSGPIDRDQFLERAAFTTYCVDGTSTGLHTARGIVLNDSMQMLDKNYPKIGPINREPVAQCHFDKGGASLGARGESDYANYYGTLGLEEAARVVQRWRSPPELRLDMDKLGLNKEMLESNGLDVGGKGLSLAITDISHGQARWISLHHTKDSDRAHGIPDSQPGFPYTQAALSPADPAHPDHAMLEQIRAGVRAIDQKIGKPYDDASERVSRCVLAACKDNREMYPEASDVSLSANALKRVDHVLMGKTGNVFAIEGQPADPAHHRAVVPVELALRTPVEQSDQKLEAANQ